MQDEDASGASRMPWVGGLFVFLALLAFLPTSITSIHPFDTPKRAVEAACLLVLFVCACVDRPLTRRLSVTFLSGLSLLLWMILRSCLKPNPLSELTILCSWLFPLLMFLAGLRMRGVITPLAGCIGVAALVQAVYMMIQYAGWGPIFWFAEQPLATSSSRMIGTIGYHNQAAGFLGVGAAAMVFLSNRSKFWLAGSILVGTVMVFTGCRTALVALVLAGAAGAGVMARGRMCRNVLLASKRRVALVAMLGAVLMTVLVALPTVRGRWATLLEGRASVALKSRMLMGEVAIRMWAQKPLQGWGAGEYAFQYIDRLGSMLDGRKNHPTLQALFFSRHAHNEFLQFATEFGCVGLLLAANLLWAVVRDLRREGRNNPQGVGLGVSLLTYLAVGSLFAFPLQSAVEGPVAALLLGACCSSKSANGLQRPGVAVAAATRIATFALGVVSAVGVAFFGYACVLEIDFSEQWLPPWAYEERALLGGELAAQGYCAEAIPVLLEASQGYRDTRLLKNLGYCLGKQNRWEEALGVFERWRRSGLDYRASLQSVSCALEYLGRYSEAADVTLKEKHLWPQRDLERDCRLAWLLMQAGEPSRAKKLMARTLAERDSPERGRRNAMLKLHAMASLMNREPDVAVDSWLKAAKLCPEDKETRHDLALCLERMGRSSEARERWEDLLRLDPTNGVARQHLEQLTNGRK